MTTATRTHPSARGSPNLGHGGLRGQHHSPLPSLQGHQGHDLSDLPQMPSPGKSHLPMKEPMPSDSYSPHPAQRVSMPVWPSLLPQPQGPPGSHLSTRWTLLQAPGV